ncbi:MAG: 3-hydroxyacyl-CoA dehydrogenase/enoyl-CoA hydratase family protein [Deltaproteobacteria bacterium]|nr:3-hydroxyacyl-CoA dehydrogenase/enoyl-CoA hydratase family protein [Deltaproteobacteria bacterium]NNK43366.1 3-hydroxyacyl-CoA dehydrogenase/enoyl-CoA hydratase family protein [Myxococcales bacterium]
MTKPVRRAGVIGAGVMGSGIMAHFANAGVDVVMLDIVPPGLSEAEKKNPAKRNQFAAGGLKGALKAKPAAFFHPSYAKRVTVGNLEDDIELLKGCDLVIEAIIENIDIKRSLFEKLENTLDEGTVVASNTSGLRIADMLQGRGDAFRKNFLVMHFFNPVRYMKLLELVAGEETAPATMERMSVFGQDQLGKGIVIGKDTPNFVGNRIGCYSMSLTMNEMTAAGLTPEDVDAITGPPMGHPKSASFRTADMVGLDTFKHVSDNCYEALVDDPQRDVFKPPHYLVAMVEQKILGNKTRGGFYKRTKEGIQTFDPVKLEYRSKAGDPEIKKFCKGLKGSPADRVKALVENDGPAGKFAWTVLSRTLAYSATMIGEIADEVEAVDDAMKWGYNWDLGPFETWDAIGFKTAYDRMKAEGLSLPASIDEMAASGAESFYTDDGRVFDLIKGEYEARDIDPRNASLTVMRQGDAPVFENRGAQAWDLGDGILGLTFTTKANSIDDTVVEGITEAVDIAERDFRGLVIYNEGDHFCVGANLFAVVMAAQQKAWDQLRGTISGLQNGLQRMKYSTIPVVAAPFGMTVGGGFEVCMGADAVQAASETYVGLVEVGVGLLPGGAGNMNMLWRALEGIPDGTDVDPLPFVSRTFQNIAMARVATGAGEAREFGYFRKNDGISFDQARLLTEAKGRAIGMAEAGYHPPVRRAYRLPGESGMATLGMMIDSLQAGGFASEHDALIARKVAMVLCGGPSGAAHEVTEEQMLELEREAFISLCGEPKSQERMQHMLTTNKPLRN